MESDKLASDKRNAETAPVPSHVLAALAAMPERFEQMFLAVPDEYAGWKPQSWEGVPGEMFSAIEQACHLRDIEVEGYQLRFRRMLEEENPLLVSLDGYALAQERHYENADPLQTIAAFRSARQQTLALLEGIGEQQWKRCGSFEGYGDVTLKGLVHFLCAHDQQHLACMQWLLAKIDAAAM